MDVNTYYSELMFILLDVYSLAVEIDEKKKHAERDHIFEEKRQEVLKKLGCKFIELMQVKGMANIMKLVEYKHLFVNLKADN